MFTKYILILFIIATTSGCIAKSKIQIRLMKGKQTDTVNNFNVANVQIINHQILITGSNLNSVTDFQIKEGATTTDLEIESTTNTSIVANTLSNVSFAAGKVFEFIISNASGASTFTVNFSLCDSTLGGKGFNCIMVPNDKDVLSYDALTDKWIPRNVNGLNYKATFDASPGVDPGGSPMAGDYYIISVAGTINTVSYAVGDWIVYNADDLEWQKVSNSKDVISVFGRTGKISAREGDYNLTKMSDVDLTTVAPVLDQILKYNGTNWVPATLAAPAAAAGTAGAPGFSFSGNANTGFFRPAVNQIGITNNGVESVRINDAGYVGIGTATPGAKLDVNGSLSVGTGNSVGTTNATALGNSNVASGTNSFSTGYINGSTGAHSFTANYFNIASGVASAALGEGNYSNSRGQLVVGTYGVNMAGSAASIVSTDPLFIIGNGTGTGARSNAMTVLKNGNVGIGTASPTVKLDVSGGLKATSMQIGSTVYQSSGELNAGAGSYVDPHYGYLYDAKFGGPSGGIAVAGRSYFVGNVGIGTTTPGSALEVVGEVRTTDGAGNNRLWAQGRPNALRYGTSGNETGLCISGSIKFGLSIMAISWEGAAAVCPKGTWVCTAAERGSAACDTVRPDNTQDGVNGGGGYFNWASNAHQGWVADAGDNQKFSPTYVDETGTSDGSSNWSRDMRPVWCCSY